MVRGILGGGRLEAVNPLKKLKVLALDKGNQEIVLTLLNPSRKKFRDVSIQIDESLDLKKNSIIKIYQFSQEHRDDFKESGADVLEKFSVEPESIVQFVIPVDHMENA